MQHQTGCYIDTGKEKPTNLSTNNNSSAWTYVTKSHIEYVYNHACIVCIVLCICPSWKGMTYMTVALFYILTEDE